MTAEANWSYTAKATIWRVTGKDSFNSPQFAEPETFYCDYQGGISAKLGDIGVNATDTTTLWTEYSDAKVGDFIKIGESSELSPASAGAHRVMFITQYADTFHRTADDYAIVTGKA